MVSPIKTLVVKELASRFKDFKNMMFIGYRGASSLQTFEVRRDLRKKQIELKVVKNSLAKLAFKQTGAEAMASLLEGPVAVATGQDVVLLAKSLVEWAKKVPAMEVKGAFVEGQILRRSDVEKIAALPSKQELYRQALARIQAPLYQAAYILRAPLVSLHAALAALRDKKQKETGG